MKQKKPQFNSAHFTRRSPLRRIAAGIAALFTVQALSIPTFAADIADPLCGLDHAHEPGCFTAAEEAAPAAPDLTGKVLHTHNKYCYDSASSLICPMEELKEHVHTDDCYTLQLQESAPEAQPHVHSDSCYTPVRGAQICTHVDTDVHTHTDTCYETAPLPEGAHRHSDSCYTRQQGGLICALAELAGHSHGSGCFARSETPVCGAEENEAHSHGDPCYEKVLACQTPEEPGHAHGGESCYEWTAALSCGLEETAAPEKILVCTQPEAPEHAHTDACFEWTAELTCGLEEAPSQPTEPAEPVKVLTCTKFELKNHIHNDSCYETDPLGNKTLICTQLQLESHQHTESCLGLSPDMLLCQPEEGAEHSHSYSCYSTWTFLCQVPEEPAEPPAEEPTEAPAEDSPKGPKSDPYADLESRSVWEKTLAHVELTGVWSQDVLNIAHSQLGYEESQRNFKVYQDGHHKGYTRYGQWYGFPYGDWCAMFASFCLNYAGITDFPLASSCAHWITALTESGLYAESDVYTPNPGDLVFFDHGRVSATAPRLSYSADHVAIVVEVIPATQTETAKLVTIEGNHNDRVCYETRELNSPSIIGYGLLPDGPSAIYSCGLPAHCHDDICYDEGENIACRMREHAHDRLCRSKSIHYSDESMRLSVTLPNALAVPNDLQLSVALLNPGSVPEESGSSGEDALVIQVYLTSGGQRYQLPAGTQAEIQVCFKRPVLTSVALADNTQLRAVMLSDDAQNSAALSAAPANIIAVDHTLADGGIAAARFLTNRIGSFAVSFTGQGE